MTRLAVKCLVTCGLLTACLLSSGGCGSKGGGPSEPTGGERPGEEEKLLQPRASLKCDLEHGATSLAISSDGATAIVQGWGPARNVQIWNLSQQKQLHTIGNPSGSILPVAITRDGKLGAYASLSKVYVVDVATGAEKKVLSPNPKGELVGFPAAVRFNPAGDVLVLAWGNGVFGWKVPRGEVLFAWEADPDEVTSMSDFFDRGRKIASGGKKGAIKIWDVASGKPIQNLQHDTEKITALAVTEDGKVLASASDGYKEKIKIWNLADSTAIRTIKGKTAAGLSTLALLQDGQLLAYPGDRGNAGDNFMIYVEDTQTGRARYRLEEHKRSIRALVAPPAGLLLLSGSQDDTVKLWDLK